MSKRIFLPPPKPVDRDSEVYDPHEEFEPILQDMTHLENVIEDVSRQSAEMNGMPYIAREDLLGAAAAAISENIDDILQAEHPITRVVADELHDEYGYPYLPQFIGLAIVGWSALYLRGLDIRQASKEAMEIGREMNRDYKNYLKKHAVE